ncbi:hypothetical protein HOY80DRAFT_1033570 [Tuber brumale]|nr:hypothetical protein HOY80DRAFT_1033570 [Tuber brumale]
MPPNTKGTSHERRGTGFGSFPASEEYNRAPNTKDASDKHMDTGLHGFASSEKHYRILNTKADSMGYPNSGLRDSISSKEYYFLNMNAPELVLKIECLKCLDHRNMRRSAAVLR